MSNTSSPPALTCSSAKLPVARCVCPEMRPGRKTVAVLVDYLDQITDGYESALRAGFEARCRVKDLNLLIIVGRALDAKESDSVHYNDVYRLLVPSCMDGLILVSTALSQNIGVDAFTNWCKSLGSLPICSLGLALPGLPSIVADNRAGMSAVVEHIVTVHQRKKIAMLYAEQNPDGLERLEAFRGVARKRGLPIDPRLIISAQFDMSTAERAILALIDDGGKFDAVIAANDGMALGALRALEARHIRVPEDVLVSGFDDISISRFSEPGITTVRVPLERMAELAVNAIVDQWEGTAVSECTAVQAQLVVRGSCGCEQASMQPPGHANTNDLQARQLANALEAERLGQKGALLAAAKQQLKQLDPNETDSTPMLYRLVDLRVQSSAAWSSDLENAWNVALRAIYNFQAQHQATQRLRVEAMYLVLLGEARHLVPLTDTASLKRGLEVVLSNVHPKDLAIGLVQDATSGQIELLAHLKNGKSVALPDRPIDVLELFNETRRRTQYVLPITSETRMVGVMAIEAQDDFFNYQALRDHISTALSVVALQQETMHQATLRERSVQERVATAERMRSLSVLAGGVAHDLNNAMGSLVALSDVVLEELDERRLNPMHDESELRADLVSMKQGALRAAETIKDLMTLGRRDQVQREPLDLNRAIQNCIRDLRMQLPVERFRAVQLRVESSVEPLPILGSESHVIRAVGNLLRNAIEVAGEGGTVVVRTETFRLKEPLLAYEVIPPGEYATVCVNDTGPGIAAEQVKKIFEPFFSTKKLSEVSGSGLGLAIVHGVVKEHGGFVDVASEVGRGTKFTLYFPQVEYIEDDSEAPASVHRGQAKILVVDDDPIQLRVASRVLGRLGYEVTTISSGVQAYQLVCGSQGSRTSSNGAEGPSVSNFDVLIMDMALNEDQTGLEIFQNIRRTFSDQKGIIASGHSAISGDISIPNTDLLWLAKPYTVTSLARAVQSMLSPKWRLSTKPPKTH
jgi:signal transduction histidine kinase/DNA-binding LacI/PurR family transcriptional regulator/ActR/RegA family two-component response regulator